MGALPVWVSSEYHRTDLGSPRVLLGALNEKIYHGGSLSCKKNTLLLLLDHSLKLVAIAYFIPRHIYGGGG